MSEWISDSLVKYMKISKNNCQYKQIFFLQEKIIFRQYITFHYDLCKTINFDVFAIEPKKWLNNLKQKVTYLIWLTASKLLFKKAWLYIFLKDGGSYFSLKRKERCDFQHANIMPLHAMTCLVRDIRSFQIVWTSSEHF